ncbi:hypothetical protein B0H63DRAFT_547187 [Podospora didyma]|uniref:Galactose oxidase n=1 Tax=Podospora didyma TaxID=330526 RepID=A0AAE0KJW5_9PEZI|nr:hypothetical protein B0H63DRAFT_547187 [Podospora didyma]
MARWDVTLDFPLVLVTAWLNPKTGKVVTVASYLNDHFDADKERWTVLAEWDPVSGDISEKIITETKHGIFSPGTSMHEKGQVMFTGGTFMIGGGWSGGDVNASRDGEIYDPNDGRWTLLGKKISADSIRMSPGMCQPESKSTDSACNKTEWQQHHPWLFAWKDGSVFHGGPSKQMNWFHLTKGSEKVEAAGRRLDDGDAVCGVAVMHDAVAGSIVTAGGAPNCHYWVDAGDHKKRGYRFPATNVFGLTLGQPGQPVNPQKLAPMKHARIFSSAVILLTGEIFIVGGQTKGEGFYDDNCVLTPEIYNPTTNTWREANSHSTPRVYHSWALLLPDSTVLVGGGGLNKNHEEADHYGTQIYQPEYLLNAPRPKIVDGNLIGEYKLGSTKIPIQTDMEVDTSAASLIRYSAATDSLNNDLRRIPLKLTFVGKDAGGTKFGYAVDIPGDPGVALPGYWMLFVLSKKGGVPSVAKTSQSVVKRSKYKHGIVEMQSAESVE